MTAPAAGNHTITGSTHLRLAPRLTDAELRLYHKWEHDSAIHHLHVILGEGKTLKVVEPETLRTAWQSNAPAVERYFIEIEARPVGTASIHTDPPWMLGTEKPTGWLGICIGEEDARGKGIGRRVMELLHDRCKEMECVRIELGVFEFNDRAQHLYRSMGYRQIGTVPHFTWYDGRWWSDIRLELALQ